MRKITQVAEMIQTALVEEAERAGQESGFIKRRRKMSGATFVQSMVFGWLSNGDASLSELQQAIANVGVQITPQGLDYRFTREAAECVYRVLQHVVRMMVEHQEPSVPLLARFEGVYIIDSSVISLPPVLHAWWSGCGGSAGKTAAVKLQTRLNYSTGQLCDVLLRPGREHDATGVIGMGPRPKGSLQLQDLGYFKLDTLAADAAAGRYWLTRLKTNTALYTPQGERLELVSYLQHTDATRLDLPLRLGKRHQIACRLVAQRLAPDQAAAARRKLKRAAQKRGQTLSQARLALADWLLFITNVPPAMLTTQEVLILARVRWQIELLFKLWKSEARLAVSRSTQPWRVLCEFYAKLIAVVVQHWILVVCCWANPLRSLTKATRPIQKYAFQLARVLQDRGQLGDTLLAIAQCLAVGCSLDTRASQPSTAHSLLDASLT